MQRNAANTEMKFSSVLTAKVGYRSTVGHTMHCEQNTVTSLVSDIIFRKINFARMMPPTASGVFLT